LGALTAPVYSSSALFANTVVVAVTASNITSISALTRILHNKTHDQKQA